MRIANIIRMILTAVLIVLVWKSSQWPVALAITLLGVNDVLIRYILRKERLHRIKRREIEKETLEQIKGMKDKLQKK